MTQKQLLAARQRGVSDFNRGVTRSACPYSDREKALAWERGWNEALLKKHQNKRRNIERFQ
jgi:ribosome modulation factor